MPNLPPTFPNWILLLRRCSTWIMWDWVFPILRPTSGSSRSVSSRQVMLDHCCGRQRLCDVIMALRLRCPISWADGISWMKMHCASSNFTILTYFPISTFAIHRTCLGFFSPWYLWQGRLCISYCMQSGRQRRFHWKPLPRHNTIVIVGHLLCVLGCSHELGRHFWTYPVLAALHQARFIWCLGWTGPTHTKGVWKNTSAPPAIFLRPWGTTIPAFIPGKARLSSVPTVCM